VALFADTNPVARPRRRRGRVIGLVLTAAAVIGLIVVGFMPPPYVIEEPGPVFNTTGTALYQGSQKALISMPGTKTYPTAGTLDMLTVSVNGDPQQPLNWSQIVQAWFDPSKAVVPIDEIYPPAQTLKQSDDESTAEMTESQQDATAAALYEQKIPFKTTISVLGTVKGTPAAGVLQKGDVVVTVNGKTFVDNDSLRAAIIANGASQPLTVGYVRDGSHKTVELTPQALAGPPATVAIGVLTTSSYKFPFPVNITLQDVGGPSAGMMFALGIIDKLTPGQLNGGKKVAGTGTITASGTVGAIGGIRQKMYGARAAGARYFLAPASNCGGPDGVRGHIPSGLTVFATSTLHQSLTALGAIASGKGLSSLPTCSTK
jgi:PDZ domain-containing protein